VFTPTGGGVKERRLSVKEVKGPGDVPEGPHYAVLVYRQEKVTESTGYECDPKWSHVGPYTRTIDVIDHLVTKDREEWVKEIGRLESLVFPDYSYVALEVKGKAKVVKKLSMEVT
jgi:hypothetical protein